MATKRISHTVAPGRYAPGDIFTDGPPPAPIPPVPDATDRQPSQNELLRVALAIDARLAEQRKR